VNIPNPSCLGECFYPFPQLNFPLPANERRMNDASPQQLPCPQVCFVTAVCQPLAATFAPRGMDVFSATNVANVGSRIVIMTKSRRVQRCSAYGESLWHLPRWQHGDELPRTNRC